MEKGWRITCIALDDILNSSKKGRIMGVIKLRKHGNSKSWEFSDTELSDKDRSWLEADLGLKDE